MLGVFNGIKQNYLTLIILFLVKHIEYKIHSYTIRRGSRKSIFTGEGVKEVRKFIGIIVSL